MKKIVFLLLPVILIPELKAQIFQGGDGSLLNPYQITSTTDLIELSQLDSATAKEYWNKHYVLTADIDFGNDETLIDWDGDGTTNWDTEDQNGFLPIGDAPDGDRQKVPFTGTFNGKGHTISNIYLKGRKAPVGLFGYLESAEIDSIGLEDAFINSSWGYGCGILAGAAYYSTVKNSYSTGKAEGRQMIGGFIGNSFKCTIKNCYSNASAVSGLHGYDDVGGFIGRLYYSNVHDCYSSGQVIGSDYFGGFTAVAWDNKIFDCYWDIQTSGQTISDEGLGITTAEFKDQGMFELASWDFSNVWEMGAIMADPKRRPRLKWQQDDIGYALEFKSFDPRRGSFSGDTLQIINSSQLPTPIEAQANYGYHFQKWETPAGDSITNQNPYTPELITSDSFFVAVFDLNSYNLNFSAASNGSLSGIKSQIVKFGYNSSAVEAIADENYRFLKWQNSQGDSITNQNPLIVQQVARDSGLTAIFEENNYIANFSSNSYGKLQGDSIQSVLGGTNTSYVEAVPNTGCFFVKWENSIGDSISNQNPLSITNIMSDTSLTAVFSLNRYEVSFSAKEYGTISGAQNQSVLFGESASQVEALAEANFHFVEWQNSKGDSLTNLNPLVLTRVNQDSSLIAVFSMNEGINNFGSQGRTGAVTFVIDDTIYLGLGQHGNTYYKDFWKYSKTTNTWERIADFPGDKRANAHAFTINGRAYVGLGKQYEWGEKDETYSDFYSYNPRENEWNKISDFGGGARHSAVCFTINEQAYIGTGSNADGEAQKDFWTYNVLTDTWTQLSSVFSGNKRHSAAAFTLNGKAYVIGGMFIDGSTTQLSDVQEYNPESGTWTEKVPADGINLSVNDGIGLAYGGKGYILYGNKNNVVSYSPELKKVENLGNILSLEDMRMNPVSFILEDKVYFGLGMYTHDDGSVFGETRYDNQIYLLDLPNPTPIEDIQLTSTRIEENQANNTLIGFLSCTDNNAGASHTYELVDNPEFPDNDYFSIVGNELRVNTLDYEQTSELTIRIRVSNNYSKSFEKIFIIEVIDDLSDNNTLNAYLPESGFKVYPNPAHRVLHIELPDDKTVKSVAIYSSNGREVLRSDFTPIINLPYMPTGLYTIQLITDKEVYSRSFIVE